MANEPKKKAVKKLAPKALKKTAAKKAATKASAAEKPAAVVPTRKAAGRRTPAAAQEKLIAATEGTSTRATTKSTRKPVALTTIVAKTDVGFGNTLHLRGSGANLSWDKGVLMGCAQADEWVWSSDSVKGEVEFKVLINDEIWAHGANATVAAGERIVIEPTF